MNMSVELTMEELRSSLKWLACGGACDGRSAIEPTVEVLKWSLAK